MNFFSDDKQDEFVATILKFKRNGYYLDIGACASVGSNNSYFFESLNWSGICIEINPQFNESYKTRTCKYYNVDALEVDYEKIFIENNFPLSIDYLSLDIDEQSTKCLNVLPLDKYRFKVITIETDSHVYGDLYRKPQREILKSKGYFLLGEDMLNQSGRNIGQEHAWEDFWADANQFDEKYLEKIYSYRLDVSQMLWKLKNLQL